MKTKHYILFFLTFMAFPVLQAQWSTDPAFPGVVCDAEGKQSDPQTFADDNGGVYVFWLDHRNGNIQDAQDVYGQHYDSDGFALWEEDGRKILHHPTKIKWFNVSKIFNNELIIGWVSHTDGEFGDSLKIQRLDPDGMKLWQNDLLVSNTGFEPNAILGLNGYHIIHDNAGYCIAIQTVYYGGSNINRITRFSSDGILTGPYTGEPEGYAYGSSGLQSSYDANNSVYLYYSSGNGASALLHCLKLSNAGDTIWGPLNVLEGTPGLNNQFSGISDENGITFVWQGAGNPGSNVNLYARRLNTAGNFVWNDTTLVICNADGEQSNFNLKKNADNFYITWADWRPGAGNGNYDIYAQKFDINGNNLWTENGILVMATDTYIPYPEFAFSENNSIIICHQTKLSGFVAQKVLDDGSIDWDPEGKLICIPEYSPFYAEHVEIQTGNKTIAVWAKTNPGGGSDNIFISRIDENPVTGENIINAKKFQIFPNPVNEKISLILPENTGSVGIRIVDSNGRQVYLSDENSSISERIEIPTAMLTAGVYLIQLKTRNEIYSQKIIVK